MIHSLRKYIRVVSVFLLVNFLYATFLPTMSYALTSGPTAPEATSFEPVDTTDMVNLQTGDFTYNIPLLEVPGPSGGYPLSLSYHAGIMPNEEASWVGLGWTLNPGAINRTVNGFADDHADEMVSSRFFWQGGERVNHSLSFYGKGGFTAGIQVSNDTYKGFGWGFYAESNLSEDMRLGGIAGYHSYSGIYGGLSYRGNIFKNATEINKLMRYDLSARFSSQGVSVSAAMSANVLGIESSLSMNTNSIKPKFSVGIGANTIHNSGRRVNDWYNYEVPINLGFINYKYEYQRYFINEIELKFTVGALHYPTSIEGLPSYVDDDFVEGHVFDNSNLFDIYQQVLEEDLPAEHLGGTVPDIDDYMVLGQGIGGSIKPYFYQSYLINNYRKNEDAFAIKNYLLGSDVFSPSFRFINDFSNRHTYESGGFNDASRSWFGPLGFDFDWGGKPEIGDGIINGVDEKYRVAGSRNIVYLTNDQIHQIKDGSLANEYGFMETQSSGFTLRSEENYDFTTNRFYTVGQWDSQIGSFIVTNESGVKYHYSLPVYNRNEYYFNENVENTDSGQVYDEFKKPDPYAYTWLLTAITGPDFVDRGGENNDGDGLFDENDWGYWVEFDYGKWTDEYRWRNPTENFQTDLDDKYQYFVEGTKEIYYLDAIRTKTHTALFVKEIRKDAKSVINVQRNKAWFGDDLTDLINFKVDIPAWKEDLINEGRTSGFIPKALENFYYHAFDEDIIANINYLAKPVSTLKLNKIVLLSNDNVAFDRSAGVSGEQEINYTVHEYFGDKNYVRSVKQHLPNNVIDINDFLPEESFENAIRVIDFETDYSLQHKVPNSFDGTQLQQDEPDTNDSSYLKSGKLTLKALRFGGKYGNQLIPPIEFKYALNPEYVQDAYDRWGYYKSDFDKNKKGKADYRVTTLNSSKEVHAWSLTELKSSLGASIQVNYESDTYSKAVLQDNFTSAIKTISYESPNITRLVLVDTNIYKNIPNTADVEVFIGYRDVRTTYGDGCNSYDQTFDSNVKVFSKKINNAHYANGVLTISDDELYHIVSYDEFDINEIAQGECVGFLSYEMVSCNIAIGQSEKFGGGVRVKDIKVINPIINKILSTSYEYSEESYSSGVTSSEPKFFDEIHLIQDDELIKSKYKFKLINHFIKLFSLSRFAPAPGVFYENVTQRMSSSSDDENMNWPSIEKYSFEVFNEGMIGVKVNKNFSEMEEIDREINGTPYSKIKNRSLAIKNYTHSIGDLKKHIVFDSNGKIISEVNNHFLRDLNASKTLNSYIQDYEANISERFLDQGVIEETFADARFVLQKNNKNHLVGVITKLEEFPSVLLGKTSTNYKTGITTTTENLAFDFYSGAVTQTRTTDGFGNVFVSESIPAYRKYGGLGGMGLAINGGKNMLTQTAANYTWKVDPDNNDKQALLSANVQTWNNQWTYRNTDGTWANQIASEDTHPVWRKHRSYSYLAQQPNTAVGQDGLTPFALADFEDFDKWYASAGEPEKQWQKNSEITLYDRYSHALEAKDVNDNYAATRMDSRQEKVIATVANASYDEFAYSGAEDEKVGTFYGGGVEQPAGTRVTKSIDNPVHTGNHAVKTTGTGVAFKYTIPKMTTARNFVAEVWMSNDKGQLKYALNGGAAVVAKAEDYKSADGWHLARLNIPVTAANSSLEVWCQGVNGETIFFDDFRVHPIDAPMTSYVYNDYDELAFVLDNHNLYTEYIYDGMGRLKETYRESFQYGRKKISAYTVHYSTTPESNK